MTHLRIVDEIPPELDEGDDGGDDDGEGLIAIDVSISGVDDGMTSCRKFLDGDTPPEELAQALIMTMRGAVASFDLDVQLAFERRLLHWRDPDER
ncbi:hypothetical protein [Pseudonocardia sp. NPDC049154]|uniref:hypothetical protein n=1 Tax=Pseudonocardia sp. NPDC049154 TaxID=3155501 RepID=UPI0033CC6754